jgi:RNA polymerase sigma-70 factor (ECF subfamily)
LLRIAHNMSIDHIRRRSSVCEEPEVMAAPETPAVESHHLRDAIRDALSELPDPQREIVVLRHVAGLSPREIAERLGRSEDSVHGLHHRGRRALQAALTQAGAVPATAAA